MAAWLAWSDGKKETRSCEAQTTARELPRAQRVSNRTHCLDRNCDGDSVICVGAGV